jgi:hypothetical protein
LSKNELRLKDTHFQTNFFAKKWLNCHRKVKPKNLLFPPEFGIQKFLWKGEQHPSFFSLSKRAGE